MNKIKLLLNDIKREEMKCRKCQEHIRIRKEHGDKEKHRHCQSVCPVGVNIRKLGDDLQREYVVRKQERAAERN
jgi:ferredoxin